MSIRCDRGEGFKTLEYTQKRKDLNCYIDSFASTQVMSGASEIAVFMVKHATTTNAQLLFDKN